MGPAHDGRRPMFPPLVPAGPTIGQRVRAGALFPDTSTRLATRRDKAIADAQLSAVVGLTCVSNPGLRAATFTETITGAIADLSEGFLPRSHGEPHHQWTT